MKTCTPAIFIAAIFTALLVLDLIYKNYNDVGFHVAGGVFCVIGLYTACELAGEELAWVLLGIPFIFLLIGLTMIWVDSQKETPKHVVTSAPANVPVANCPCPRCYSCPCRCMSGCQGSGLDPVYNTPPPPPSPPLGCPPKTA